jgi:two-component system response regulator AtoC
MAKNRRTSMTKEGSVSSAQSPVPLLPAGSDLLPSCSPTMRELQCAISDIARSDLPVLLIGEKGTGKEVIARHIHAHHGGVDALFVKVQCSGHNPLFFKKLFEGTAHEESERPEQATTVFLDEIGDLDPQCQTTVAEAIDNGNAKALIHRSGTRLISTSSKSLEEEVHRERFREDLFYRINGICLQVPPLRHRKEDIPALMEFFLKLHGAEFGTPPVVLRAETIHALLQHSWPGNVRELEDFAKKIVLSDENTALAGLMAGPPGSATHGKLSAVFSLKEAARNASRQVERELILKTLARTRWNRKRAARDLGISYKALLYKLKHIAVDDPTGT